MRTRAVVQPGPYRHPQLRWATLPRALPCPQPGSRAVGAGGSQLIVTALAQLVDNAMKYSVPGSPIDIGIAMRDTDVTVTVRNQGVVIAPADRERIFERFYRATGMTQGPAGTGLGLAIVKRIVDAHHGRVWVESDAGASTIFSIALPRAPKRSQ